MAANPVYRFRTDQELPVIPMHWANEDGTARDFSTGWTFTAKLGLASTPSVTLLTKSAGITGAATYPNISIAMAVAEWAGLATPPETGTRYVFTVYARRTADSRDEVFPGDGPQILLLPASS
jgi:hypothetical protein